MGLLLLRYASEKGLDLHDLKKISGLDRFNSENRIPIKLLDRLWQEIQAQTGDSDFGIHLGEMFVDLAEGHILFSVMRNCPTIETALNKFFQYHSLMADTTHPSLVYEKDMAVCTFKTTGPRIRLNRHQAEATLSIVSLIIRRLSEGRIKPIEVRFQHARPVRIDEHERVFNASVSFKREANAIILSREDIQQPIFLANPDFLDAHEKMAQKLMQRFYAAGTCAGKVKEMTGKIISRGDMPRIGEIAGRLAMSKRKLQAELKKEGTHFRKLLNEARRELAELYLENPDTSICDIAFLLGFSEQSAFNHAFRRWTGSSPRKYRMLKIQTW